MNPFQSVGITGIPSKYVFPLPGRSSSQEKRFIVAAHINWVRELISGTSIPTTFPSHERLQEEEVQAFLSQGKAIPLGPQWMILLLTVIKSPKGVLSTFRQIDNGVNAGGGKGRSAVAGGCRMTWPQIVDFIGESNFNYVWEQPELSLLCEQDESLNKDLCSKIGDVRRDSYGATMMSRFPASNSLQQQQHQPFSGIQMEESAYLSKLLKCIYINLEESGGGGKDSSGGGGEEEAGESERFPVSNLCQAVSIVTVPFISPSQSEGLSHDMFFIFHPYSSYTLHDAVTFSPQKLASTGRQMFVCYQILQFLRDFRTLQLPLGDLSLRDFFMDECLYLNVVPPMLDTLEQLKEPKEMFQSARGDPRILDIIRGVVKKVRGWEPFDSSIINSISSNSSFSSQVDPKVVEAVIRHWCEGLVSNYDYLMFLNYMCGRYCNGNPNFHPVFPWVTDFSQPQGCWRDLTKSKFRLNKGERQLDIMYEEIGSNEKTVAHHVTDILSEITYYVYKARRTSKDVLCKFVRPKWVPAEYPASITRLQDWTPDECIPEYFDDPLIFKSIHDDLPDLQVPKWCSGPDEFIKYHRRVLESDYVSAKLHHWIDLTFGYKLSGQAAVKSKNIYLSLVDSHQYLESHGVVQLFQNAHPPRKSTLRNLKNTVSYKDVKRLRELENEESSQDAINASDPKTKVWKNINLPKHYDPMGFLNDFEVTMNFFKTHFPYLKNPLINLTGLKNRSEIPHSIKLFGCLLLELVLPQKVRHVAASVTSVEEKFEFYKEIVKGTMNLVPLYCRRATQAIFDRDSLEFSIPLDISLDILLLGDRLGPIPFPMYFEDIYKMLRTMRNQEKILATVAPDNFALKTHLQEFKVKTFSRELIQLLGSLDTDGIDLVLPYVIELFENPETRVLAVWNLFCPFSRAIGKKRAAEHLLYPIIQIYEADYHSDKHLKLFHRTFLLQLSSCFGLKIFLDYFSTLLIEAIGGWKASGDQNEPLHRTHLNSTELEIEQHEENTSSSGQTKGSVNGSDNSKGKTQNLKRNESESGESVGQPVEPEMFVMEPDVSDSEGNESTTESTVEGGIHTQFFPSIFVNDQKQPGNGSTGSSRNQSPLLAASGRYHHPKEGRNTRSSSISSVGTIGSKSVVDISELCCESVMWLSHRLGPVLTAKYLTKNLLRMLTLCYLDHLELLDRSANPSKEGFLCEGDIHSKKVLDCLILASDLYGDSFIDRQYIPYCIEIINSAAQKMTVTVEAALIGISTLLEKVFQFMADTLLMAQLKEPVIKCILAPLVEIVCAESSQFPSGTVPRTLLLNKCLGMMNSIKKKIGPDLGQLHLKPLLKLICCTFDAIYNGRMKAELSSVFDSSVASQIFTNFCDVIAGSEVEPLIRDLYLRQGLTAQSLALKDDASPTSEKAHEKRRVEQQSSFGSRSFGNRIQVHEQLEPTTEEPETVVPSKKDPTRHLRGNWLVYWEHEVGRSDSKFNFKQIKLHTFVGHNASVRCIYSLDNENSFLTASKDKTVKVYSLRNQGDENVVSNCQWTYSQHKKAVLSVLFLESSHLAVSTDGFIHVWDPFVGKTVRILDKGTAAKTSQVCSLRPILNTSYFVGAGIDSNIHLVDSRSCSAYELKIGIGQASGLVRCMAVSDSGQIVSVGHSSGMLSTLDLRNGTLLGSWKGHEGEVLQLMPYKNKHLISSSFDQNISVWNLDDNRPAFNMKGPTEPVHSLCTYENELISCTTSNRIGIHCGIDANSDFSSTRLRSDTFKGIVTSMRLLPLNQFLLLGSDSGHVGLLC